MRSWYRTLTEDQGVVVFNGFDLSRLRRDEAYVVGNHSFLDAVGLYSVQDDCFKCPLKLTEIFHKDREVSWIVNTSVQYTWRFLNSAREEIREHNDRSGLICELRPRIGEFGVYRIKIGSCILQPELGPVDIYTPLILTAVLLMVLGVVYSLFVTARAKFFQEKQSNDQKQHVAAERKTLALDIFQGLATLLWLFFVSGAGGYYFLSRSWHGILVEDVLLNAIFWGVGFGLPNFVHSSLKKHDNKLFVLWRIVKWILPLALFDVVLQSISRQGFEVSILSRPLERIALAYIISGVTYTITALRKPITEQKSTIKKICADLRDICGCMLILCLLYAAYVILEISLVSNSKELNNNSLQNSSENMKRALFYVKLISGQDNQIHNISSYYLFKDGLLGLISTAVYVLFGIQAGSAAVHHKDHYSRMKRWAFWALTQTILTAILAIIGWNTNLNFVPISFTLISSAGFQLVFYILYMVTDICYVWHDLPFYAVGRNALLVITGQTLCGGSMPLWWDIHLRTHFLFLLQNLWIILFWILVCGYIVKKNYKISL